MTTHAVNTESADSLDVALAADSFLSFRALLRGRDRAYFTDEVAEQNMRVFSAWALENDLGIADMQTVGFWQLAFANCDKSTLTVDPNAPIFQHERKLFRQRVGAMSVAEIKEAAKHEAGFADEYQALQAAEDVTFGVKGF
jgi:hypothetical protein